MIAKRWADVVIRWSNYTGEDFDLEAVERLLPGAVTFTVAEPVDDRAALAKKGAEYVEAIAEYERRAGAGWRA